MAALDRTNGYFIDSLNNLRDPIRTNLWRLNFNIAAIKANFPSGLDFLSDIEDTDSISFMVRSATVPKITVNSAESWYMGQSSKFSTNTEYAPTSTFEIEERQDVKGWRFLLMWNQHVHNTDALYHTKLDEAGTNRVIDPESDTPVGLGTNKYPSSFNRGLSLTRNTDWVSLDLYDYTTGEIIMRVSYVNFWPSEIGEASLSYENPTLMKYTFTATHDRYKYVVPKINGKIG